MNVTFDYDENRGLGVIQSSSLNTIRDRFSEYDEQARIKKKVSGYKYIPSRNYCITKSGKFELGMTHEIIKFIKSQDFYRIKYTDEFKNNFIASFSFWEDPLAEINKPENFQERFYQTESIRKALKIGNGIFLLKTAAGKTYISAQLIATIREKVKDTKTLIIVPTIQLVEQTYKDFLFFGYDSEIISKWSGKNKLNEDAEIIIASSSILLSKSQDLSVLEKITLLILDECHILKKSNKINHAFRKIKTRNKFGFTGTLPESKLDQWNLIGKIGPILYELSRDVMVENKFISDAEIMILSMNYETLPKYKKKNIHDPLKNYEIETKFSEENSFRNYTMKKICSKISKNVLIVVEHLSHGELLKSILEEIEDKQVFFIRGDVELEDREKYKQVMEKNDNVVCIAISKIFSTGINIKNLHYIIFASAGKAKIKLIQSIGRGVRLHENKNKLYIFDIADNLEYGRKHLIRRKEIYEEEGFICKQKEIQEEKRTLC